MSQHPPTGDEQWKPPPPPSVFGDSPFDPRVLADKVEFVNKNAYYALVFAIFGILCCGLLSVYAFSLSNSVIETIDYYSVAQDKRAMTLVARALAAVGLILWIVGFIYKVVKW
jgi:hypothetical protein